MLRQELLSVADAVASGKGAVAEQEFLAALAPLQKEVARLQQQPFDLGAIEVAGGGAEAAEARDVGPGGVQQEVLEIVDVLRQELRQCSHVLGENLQVASHADKQSTAAMKMCQQLHECNQQLLNLIDGLKHELVQVSRMLGEQVQVAAQQEVRQGLAAALSSPGGSPGGGSPVPAPCPSDGSEPAWPLPSTFEAAGANDKRRSWAHRETASFGNMPAVADRASRASSELTKAEGSAVSPQGSAAMDGELSFRPWMIRESY